MPREEAAKNARFQLKDARITRVVDREKCAFLSVLCRNGKYPNYYDVTVFDGHLKTEEGAAVTIGGEIQMRKPREEGGRWEVQLVARRIEPADDALAPVPRARGVRDDGDTDTFGDQEPSF